MNRYLLLGTAGHVDHGKTALIQALTGVDTDRLPEEKRRGLTIDLGFAVAKYEGLTIGIVDVPGHEALIKNMLAGATGIDLAMLVVAADEGVMQQTCEHFQVLQLLGLTAGVVALTKCDLVDEQWLNLVKQDVAALVVGSFLQDAPLIPVSAKAEAGLDELHAALRMAAANVDDKATNGPFRMAIDRAFSAPGHGAVVTGSVASGSVEVGARLELMPQGTPVQVRALESHSRRAEKIQRGQRAALNLNGVHYRDIARGQTLAADGSLKPSRMISVIFKEVGEARQQSKTRCDVRLYAGAAEVAGRMTILSTEEGDKGRTHFAQIESKDRICVVWKQPYVLRGLTENALIGGGWVVDPLAYRVRSTDAYRIQKISELAATDEPARAAAFVALAGVRDWDRQSMELCTGVADSGDVVGRLVSAGTLRSYQCANQRRVLHRDTVEKIENRILLKLLGEHESAPLQSHIPLGRLQKSFSNLEPSGLLAAIAEQLAAESRVILRDGGLAHPDWSGGLSARQLEVSQALIAACRDAGLTPPTVGESATSLGLPEEEIESLLQLAADAQVLARLPDKQTHDRKAARRARLFLHRSREEELIGRVRALWSVSDRWTVSEFREAFELSRKYAVPLCEHLDKLGVTLRIGEHRQLK